MCGFCSSFPAWIASVNMRFRAASSRIDRAVRVPVLLPVSDIRPDVSRRNRRHAPAAEPPLQRALDHGGFQVIVRALPVDLVVVQDAAVDIHNANDWREKLRCFVRGCERVFDVVDAAIADRKDGTELVSLTEATSNQVLATFKPLSHVSHANAFVEYVQLGGVLPLKPAEVNAVADASGHFECAFSSLRR